MFAAMIAALAAFTPLHGDFDHDGRRDTAQIVRTDGQFVLRVTRGADPRHPVILERYGSVRPVNTYADVAKAGRLQTACAKGLGADSDPCPYAWVTLKGGELAFGTEEASMAVSLWTGRTFEVVWISD